MNRERACLFVSAMAALYEMGMAIVTSNLPLGQWGARFAQYATLTGALRARLLRYTHMLAIAGESYRLKRQRQAGIVKGTGAARLAEGAMIKGKTQRLLVMDVNRCKSPFTATGGDLVPYLVIGLNTP